MLNSLAAAPIGKKALESFAANRIGAYCIFENLDIEGDIDLEGEEFNRPLRFRNCRISGKFWAKDARFRLLCFYDCEMQELRLHRATVEQSVIVQRCSISRGVQMRSAIVGQSVSFAGSIVSAGDVKPVSLDLSNCRIERSLFLSVDDHSDWPGTIDGELFESQSGRNFQSSGVVRLSGIEVGGNIDCRGARILGKKAHHISREQEVLTAIDGMGLRCGGSFYLSRGFKSLGEVNLKRGRISLLLDCGHAEFDNGGDANADALYLRYINIGTDFFYFGSKRVSGAIDLCGMETKTFHDDIDSWNLDNIGKRNGYIRLNGLVYDRLVNNASIRDRVRWLEAQPPGEGDGKKSKFGFRPQPWTQLADALERAGHRRRADEFRYLRDRKRLRTYTKEDTTGNEYVFYIWRGILWLHGLLNGFNHRPLRTSFYSALSILLFGVVYARAYEIGMIKPSQPIVFLALEQNELANAAAFGEIGPGLSLEALSVVPVGGIRADEPIAAHKAHLRLVCPPKDYEPFNPFLYSFDVFLPFLDFHQESNWEVRFDMYERKASEVCLKEKPQRDFGFDSEPLRTFDGLISKYAKLAAIFERILGWLLTLLAGVAFAGILRQSN